MRHFFATLGLGLFLTGTSWAGVGPLVSTQWLAAHLDDPRVRMVSVEDVDVPTYATGHIPGAVQVVLQTDLMTTPRRNFIDPAELEALAASLGLRTGQTVVFYDAGELPVGGLPSVYGYWVFRYRGAANVTVLDGGLAKWRAEGREVTTAVPRYPRGNYSVAGTVPGLRMFARDILRRLPERQARLIDVRTGAEYFGRAGAPPGKPDVVLALGHIPTASHVYWEKSLSSEGIFKSKRRLKRLYRHWLRPDARPIASYCLRGERGVVTWFVLHELLGQQSARLYDGSWSEWGNLVNAPVAR